MELSENYTVYMHTVPNGKVYIGITSQEPHKRWKRGRNYRNNIHFTRAVEKYGWDNIKHEILYTFLSPEEAEKCEQELIMKYDSTNPENGYNITSGGEKCKKLSESTKKKISEIKREQYKSEEFRKKLSIAHKGIPAHNKGIPMSDEQKKKVSLAKKGSPAYNNKKVICIETGAVFNSLKDASFFAKVTSPKICEVCRGTRKTAGGYHWKYYKGEENAI